MQDWRPTTNDLQPTTSKKTKRFLKEVLVFSLFVVCCLLFVTDVRAQVSIGEAPAPVQYTVTPEIPGPSTSVAIQVEGVGNFIGNSTITWTLDGKTALQGTGANKFSFTT